MNWFHRLWILIFILSEDVGGTFVKVSDDGGYENVVVAFSPEIQNDDPTEFINNLQVLMNVTSRRLYAATQNKFYFKSVSILIPQKWSDFTEYRKKSTFELYKDADIRVVNPETSSGDHLFTQQPRGCGKFGDYVQMSTTFLNESLNDFDYAALRLVREWSRLRFGIFEETSLENFEQFPPTYYGSEGIKKVTGCINPYKWTYNPDEQCENRVYSDPCGFTVDKELNYQSSLMDYAFNKTETFCNGQTHNSESPTPHNALCREKSTWDIITSSRDFKAIVGNATTNFVAPKIQVVSPTSIQIMFIIDPSLCFDGRSKTSEALKLSLLHFLKYDLKGDYDVGIMFADLLDSWVLNTFQQNGEELVNKLMGECMLKNPSETQFQKTIDTAAQTLTDRGVKPSLMILIANGANINTSNLLSSDFEKKINSKAIDFYLLLCPPLGTISPQTPSVFKQITIYNIPLEQNDSPESVLRSRMKFDQIFNSALEKYSSTFSPSSTLVYEAFHSDTGEGKVSLNIPGNFQFILYDSDRHGESMWPNVTINGNIVYGTDSNAQLIRSEIHSQDSLNYSVFSSEKNWKFSVVIWFEHMSNSMAVQGLIEQENNSSEKKMPPLLRVYTSMNNPVVTATIQGPENQTSKYDLLPSGSHVKTSDKIFSRYFTSFFSQPGLYDVVFTVTDSKDNPSFSLQSFGSFYSTMTKNDVDQLLPNRITDLRVDQNTINKIDRSFTFTWTAPGQYLDNGKVNAYKYQCSTNKDDLENDGKYQQINDTNPSQEAGQKEVRSGKINTYNTTYFCCVKSEGSLSKPLSDRSNIVSVYILQPPTTATTTVDPNIPTSVPKVDDGEDKSVLIGGIVGGILGFLVLLLIFFLIFFFMRRKRREQAAKEQQNNLYTGAEVVRTVSKDVDENKNIKENNSKQNLSTSNLRDSWVDIALEDKEETDKPKEKETLTTSEPIADTEVDPYATFTPEDLDRDVGLPIIHRNEYVIREDDDDVFPNNRRDSDRNKPNTGGNYYAASPDLDAMYSKVNKPPKNNFSTFHPHPNNNPSRSSPYQSTDRINANKFAETEPMFEEMDAAYSKKNNRDQADVSGSETRV